MTTFFLSQLPYGHRGQIVQSVTRIETFKFVEAKSWTTQRIRHSCFKLLGTNKCKKHIGQPKPSNSNVCFFDLPTFCLPDKVECCELTVLYGATLLLGGSSTSDVIFMFKKNRGARMRFAGL